MRAALDTLPADKWEGFRRGLHFPQSKLYQIMSQFTSDEERRDELIRIYSTQHPHPTWELVSDALYRCGFAFDDQQFHNVLDTLQSMFPTGKFCLPISTATENFPLTRLSHIRLLCIVVCYTFRRRVMCLLQSPKISITYVCHPGLLHTE